jgi:hypothetical protein
MVLGIDENGQTVLFLREVERQELLKGRTVKSPGYDAKGPFVITLKLTRNDEIKMIKSGDVIPME